MKLIGIVGTNSDRSTNRKLLQYIQKHFADKAEIEICEIKGLPAFNEPKDKTAPAGIQELADKYKAFFLEEDLERLFNDTKEYKEQLEYMDEYAARRYFDSVIMPENVYDTTSMKPIDKMSKRYQDINCQEN